MDVFELTDNPEYIDVKTDNEGKILECINIDGIKDVNVPVNVNNSIYVEGPIDSSGFSIEEIENPEFIKVYTDIEGKIICGINKDGNIYYGAGIPKQIINYINSKIKDLDIESIFYFLDGLESGNKKLSDLLNEKVDKEEGKTVIDSSFSDGIKYAYEPEYVSVVIDNEDKIIEATKKNGNKYFSCGVENDCAEISIIDNPEYIEAIIDKDYKIIEGTKNNGSKFFGCDLYVNGDVDIKGCVTTQSVFTKELDLSDEGINKLKEDLDIQEPTPIIDQQYNNIEVAAGKQRSYGTYKSELEASPFVDDEYEYNVKFDTVDKHYNTNSVNKKFIVMNHDDGNLSDTLCNRRIYNKYGFTGNSCLIFSPFSSLNSAKRRIENGKKFLNDGHAFGLHAIMGASYWYANRIYDVKPDGGSNFAPLLSEIRGNNPDGTGINTFGKTITSETIASDVYYMSTSSTIIPELNVKVVDLTNEQIDRLNRQYCFYTDEYILSGVDDLSIDDIMNSEHANIINKSRIGWVEYYYNGLVDNTLGYSSSAINVSDKFAEDYSVPIGASVGDYYPDAAHLKNGKMVYWGDTENEHYLEAKVKGVSGFNENDYQLVGKFTKGLYKDCFSTMNFEVMGRCVAAAEAFFRKYYGMNRFVEMHLHGIHYLNFYYQEPDGRIYADRERQFIYYPTARWYSSIIGTFKSVSEIMADFGMSMMKDGLRRNFVKWQGNYGFYYKADGIRNETDDFNNGDLDTFSYSITDYMNTFGTTSDGGHESMNYNTFMQFLNGVDNWTKFIYENSGQDVTKNGLTMRIYRYLRDCIRKCMGSVGTGSVPVISIDTLNNNPAMTLAVELFFRFLKDNGFDVYNFKEGKKKLLSERRSTSGNLFPNPSFEQSTLRYFGGSSTSKHAYVPDGWIMSIQGSSSSVNIIVDKQTVDNSVTPVLNVDGHIILQTSIWGLPSGKYTLSYFSKGNGVSIYTKVVKNSDLIVTDSNIVDEFNPSSEWEYHTVDIVIPDFHRNIINQSDFYSVVCDGYEDNVCCIIIRISTTNNNSNVALTLPKLIVK